MIVWMAPAAPLREASKVKEMNSQLLLLSLNKIAYYFKKWSTASGVLKKLRNSSCSQKQQYTKKH